MHGIMSLCILILLSKRIVHALCMNFREAESVVRAVKITQTSLSENICFGKMPYRAVLKNPS